MVLFGLILVLLAVGAGVLLFAGTARLTDTVDIEVLGGTLSLPPLTLLVTGMVVITVFWLGWALLRAGLRRGKRRRVEAKEAAAAAEARHAADEKRLMEEMAARDRALAQERRRRDEETAALRQQVGNQTPEHTPAHAAPGDTTRHVRSSTADEPGDEQSPEGRADRPAPGHGDPPPIAPSGSTPPPPPPTGR